MINRKEAPGLIRKEYDRLDRLCGVNSSAVNIIITGRMTRGLGRFETQKTLFGKTMTVKISTHILADEALFYDVIRHEYAHMLVYLREPLKRHNHDKVWKAACREVGCSPRATTKLDDYPAVKAIRDGKEKVRGQSGSRPYKYSVTCMRCGAVTKYKTESKVVKIAEGKLPGHLFCRRCGNHAYKVEKL